MTRDEVIAAQLANMQQAQTQAAQTALGNAYDAGLAAVPASGTVTPAPVVSTPVATGPNGSFTQDDLAAAVKAAQDADAKTLADAQADFQTKLQAANDALAAMTAKEKIDHDAVEAVFNSAQALQASLANITSMLTPAPAPTPASGT